MAKTVIRLNEDELKGMIKISSKKILKTETLMKDYGVLLVAWQVDLKEKHLPLLIWRDKV